MIVSGESRTFWILIMLGVPRGSVLLGPLLFILYTAYISTLFPRHSATGHLITGDVQTYVHDLLPLNFFLPGKLNYSQNYSIFGCPLIDSL